MKRVNFTQFCIALFLLGGLVASPRLTGLDDDKSKEAPEAEKSARQQDREHDHEDHDKHDHGEGGHDDEVLKAATAKAINFYHAFEKAVEEARRVERPLLVDFEAEWCGWCKKLDRETYGNDEVIRFVTNTFVSVKVDADKRKDLTGHYKVSGLPTILFLDIKKSVHIELHPDKKGDAVHHGDVPTLKKLLSSSQEIGRIEGFRPPDLFLAEAKKAVMAGASLAELRTAASDNPLDASAQRAYARALIVGGKLPEAEKFLREAVTRIPKNAALLFELGELDRIGGRFDKAAELYKKVLETPDVDPGTRDQTFVPLARCLISLRQPTAAEKVLGELLAAVPAKLAAAKKEDSPGQPGTEESTPALDAKYLEALFLRGYLRAILERPKEALEDLRVARDADPDGPWGFRASFIIARLQI